MQLCLNNVIEGSNVESVEVTKEAVMAMSGPTFYYAQVIQLIKYFYGIIMKYFYGIITKYFCGIITKVKQYFKIIG